MTKRFVAEPMPQQPGGAALGERLVTAAAAVVEKVMMASSVMANASLFAEQQQHLQQQLQDRLRAFCCL